MTTEDLKPELSAERTEHRMTKRTLHFVTQERNQLRTALAQIAEDCTAWLETLVTASSCDFVRRIRDHARTESQAPLRHSDTLPAESARQACGSKPTDTENCQLPTGAL
jgi:hypothetical protein